MHLVALIKLKWTASQLLRMRMGRFCGGGVPVMHVPASTLVSCRCYVRYPIHLRWFQAMFHWKSETSEAMTKSPLQLNWGGARGTWPGSTHSYSDSLWMIPMFVHLMLKFICWRNDWSLNWYFCSLSSFTQNFCRLFFVQNSIAIHWQVTIAHNQALEPVLPTWES